ncbi:MAG: sigma-54-dependent transcriptional regulator [Sphingomonadales bacterium]
MKHILIIDDDLASCRLLQLHFRNNGYQVSLAHSVDLGLETAARKRPDVIILDIRMPGRDGLEGLPDFKANHPDTPVIMITAFHDMDSTVQAMKLGADDYIHKPVDIKELEGAVSTALIRSEPDDSVMSFSQDEGRPPGGNIMVGRSRAMKEVFKTIGLVAQKPVTVLICGESGTGKELVARAIHNAGTNPSGSFVAVNCAALVETLLESDLFGHEKGAFTGAINQHPGKFALANNGTILLDEVSELSPSIQAKFLRVLQEKEFVPVGGRHAQPTNARVIAATNIELFDLVKKGAYREDLYYRLQVVTIRMPPLRERKEDLPDLIQTLLARISRDVRRPINRLSADVMDAFHAYDWPGNIRELENTLMKAVALCPGDIITLDLIPEAIHSRDPASRLAVKPRVQLSLDEVERDHVETVLASTGWHQGRSCEILGVSRPRLRRIIEKYDLKRPLVDASSHEQGS